MFCNVNKFKESHADNLTLSTIVVLTDITNRDGKARLGFKTHYYVTLKNLHLQYNLRVILFLRLIILSFTPILHLVI